MDVRIVGAHNIASRDHRLGCALVDGVIALDAGSLSVGLTFEEQRRVDAVFLTHRHYDHARDLLTLGLANYFMGTTTDVYGIEATISGIREHLLNGKLYPDPTQRPSPEDPSIRLHVLEPLVPARFGGYEVLPVPVAHAVEATGFEVAGPDGRRVFYSGDTGPGVADAWRHIRPDLMLLECTLSNDLAERARTSGHLVPRQFGEVLASFREMRSYLPEIVAIHLGPFAESAVRNELEMVAQQLGAPIQIAREDDVYPVRPAGDR